MHRSEHAIVIVAEPPGALAQLCGVSLLDRLLRSLQRTGVSKAHVLSSKPAEIAAELAKPSWARSAIAVDVLALMASTPHVSDVCKLMEAPRSEASLILSAGSYYDARLLENLLRATETTLLIDSSPPANLLPLLPAADRSDVGWLGRAALVTSSFVTNADAGADIFALFHDLAQQRGIAVLDAAKQQTYISSMRRNVRPVWFPAPDAQYRSVAERILLNAAQNGTLDLPAKLHAPIETWVIARLCQTSITPVQITLFTASVSAVVTMLFASGRLATGTILALIVGVLDGLDGKQARVKVETTELGQREHLLDYVLELSWWTALAYHFAVTRQVPNAFLLLALLVSADVVDQLARRIVKNRCGRNLDDVAPFDRCVRLVGGRRNIYIWMLAAGLLLGAADKAFVALCWWGAATAAIHVLRAIWISGRTGGTESASH